MSNIEELAEDLFGDSDQRGKFRHFSEKDKNKDRYNLQEYGSPMSVSQLEKVIQDSNIHYADPKGFRNNDNFENLAEGLRAIQEEFKNIEIKLGGNLEEGHTWIDKVWIHYGQSLPEHRHSEFKEFAILRFKKTLRDKIEGVCPDCDERVVVNEEGFRNLQDDPSLWATTSEFEFRDDEEFGKYLRMWWD